MVPQRKKRRSRTRIFALDLGLQTGWAFSDGKTRESGVEDFSLRRGDSRGMIFLNFRVWFLDFLKKKKVSLVVYEKPYELKSGPAYEVLYGMSTRVLEECDRMGVNYFAVTPSELKKFVVGKGNVSKVEILQAAKKEFRRKIENHNEADALFLLKMAEERYG